MHLSSVHKTFAICLPYTDLVGSFRNTCFSKNGFEDRRKTLTQGIVKFGGISTEDVFDDAIFFSRQIASFCLRKFPYSMHTI